MDVNAGMALLGGMSAAQFMRKHWQKRPLLVRQAWPDVQPPLPRSELFKLASQADVESRLVSAFAGQWRLRHGPFARSALPPLKQREWTLLVQGLDLHCQAAHKMLSRFRFVPDARLDDLMVSYASDGGGVGPHLDSYDVFLLQVQGQRRWRVGPVPDATLVEGAPLKLLSNFNAQDEWVLEPGDMLYLPPRWGHEGVAQGECMTCSIGFRAPAATELAAELLARLGDDLPPWRGAARYRDPGQAATAAPAQLPGALQKFARQALQKALSDPSLLAGALGSLLTEPKPKVWFDAAPDEQHARDASIRGQAIQLDRRSKMMYDAEHVFINGEAFRAAGRDAQVLAELANCRQLGAHQTRRLSCGAAVLVNDWRLAGWLHIGN